MSGAFPPQAIPFKGREKLYLERRQVFFKLVPIKNQSEALKIDVCSGDSIEPETVKASELCIIEDTGNIFFQVYPVEFIFAEKLETVVRFGTGNTRVKDFIDLDTLIKKGLNIQKLKKAVTMCFKCRERDFQIKEALKILNDKDFTEFLGEVLKNKKEYEKLNLPDMKFLLKNIKNQIEQLSRNSFWEKGSNR